MPSKNSNKSPGRPVSGSSGRLSGRRPRTKSAAPAGQAEVGRIHRYFSGIGQLQGLPHVGLHEILTDEVGITQAIVVGFSDEAVEALFFRDDFDISQPIFRSGRQFAVPVGDAFASRVVDGFGHFRDDMPPVSGNPQPVFRPAPPFRDRQAVTRPLITGLKMVDAILPLGRGQRELIVGDRRLGKSTIAETAVIHQRLTEDTVHCVYVLCGQKSRRLDDLLYRLERAGAMTYTTIVAADADASYAEQYLAPFVGCALAEHYRETGRDALIIYDDLSKHAKTYRDISLLLERAPGRETYPADIFSLHAGLLERAAQLSEEQGGGSLTALPIVETKEGDLTAYVPTNIISITDGQIVLEANLKEKGFMPAINSGLSVSRLGSQVQPKPLKDVTVGLRLSLSQQKELQKLTKMDTVISKETVKQIHRGDLTLELLNQDAGETLKWEEQAVLFHVVEKGFFDDLKKDQWRHFERLLLDVLRNGNAHLLERMRDGQFTEEDQQEARQLVTDFKREFIAG